MNRKVTYSLSDSANGYFSVDRSSGIIILEHPLDRELQSSYNISVKASDQSIVLTLSSFATVTITVLDINDNPPVFERRDYLVTVPEDTSPGTEVLSVFATSQDIGTNAEIAYFIRSGNEKGKFRINSRTGKVALTCNAKYKLQKKHQPFRKGSWTKKFLRTDSEPVSVELVTQLKDNFRMESDVNCSHTAAPTQVVSPLVHLLKSMWM